MSLSLPDAIAETHTGGCCMKFFDAHRPRRKIKPKVGVQTLNVHKCVREEHSFERGVIFYSAGEGRGLVRVSWVRLKQASLDIFRYGRRCLLYAPGTSWHDLALRPLSGVCYANFVGIS